MTNNHSLILINTNAQQGQALQKWNAISDIIFDILPNNPELFLSKTVPSTIQLVKNRWEAGYRTFIAAGGDGTLNLILNTLMELEDLKPESALLGAIGLGSSNDFHKPAQCEINGVPIRLDGCSPQLRDIGQVVINEGLPSCRKRFFVCNASIGVTAEANHLFNHPPRLLKWLKQVHTSSAILYAAVKAITSFRNVKVTLGLGILNETVQLSNLAIAKSPYVSGNMRYAPTTDVNSGELAVYLCEEMNALDLLRTLNDLSHGRFGERKGQRSLLLSQVTVSSTEDLAIEFDGEVESGKTFQFSIAPVKLSFMT